MTIEKIKKETFRLIDALKATCQQYGMGNDGNEYKVITQVFLYKYLNDKFCYEVKNLKSPIVKKLKHTKVLKKAMHLLAKTKDLIYWTCSMQAFHD